MPRVVKKQSLSLEELVSYLEISVDKLDQETVNQPVLFQEVSHLTAQAMYLLLDAKNNLEALEASTANKLRAEAEAAGGKQPTVDAIKDAVRVNDLVKAAKQLLNEAQLNYDECNGLKRSYEHRLSMIQEYSRLINGSYKQYV